MEGLLTSHLRSALVAASAHRAPLTSAGRMSAYRVVDGAGDNLPGVFVDRLGRAAMLAVYEDARLSDDAVTDLAHLVLNVLGESGVEAVYVKPFVRDRSRLGGQAPDESRSPTPRAGIPLSETLVVREYDAQFEVRPYDGFSTGLFLEHRENRRALAACAPRRALNLFAYTCAFAVPLTASGADVVNVDVSARYLAWGRRNLELNAPAPGTARFVRMDAREFLALAGKRGEQFDLVIVDPPTFAAADARRKRAAWKAVDDYPDLLRAAVRVLAPGGRIFAASNTRELAVAGALQQLVTDSLGRSPIWLPLPSWPLDVREPGRVAAVCFSAR